MFAIYRCIKWHVCCETFNSHSINTINLRVTCGTNALLSLCTSSLTYNPTSSRESTLCYPRFRSPDDNCLLQNTRENRGVLHFHAFRAKWNESNFSAAMSFIHSVSRFPTDNNFEWRRHRVYYSYIHLFVGSDRWTVFCCLFFWWMGSKGRGLCAEALENERQCIDLRIIWNHGDIATWKCYATHTRILAAYPGIAVVAVDILGLDGHLSRFVLTTSSSVHHLSLRSEG